MDKRRMCSNCRAFITTDDKVCPYCNTAIGPRMIDQRLTADAMAGLVQGDAFTTNLLLLINVGLYIATLLYSSNGRAIEWTPAGQALYVFGDKDGYAIVRGLQWWRLITAGYLHANLLHIGVNMYSLFQLGPLVDSVFGTYRYLAIYTVSTFTGFGLSLLWAPNNPAVGASAAISGLVGAMVGLGLREKNTALGREARRFYPVAVLVLAQGFLLPLPIDNAAHIWEVSSWLTLPGPEPTRAARTRCGKLWPGWLWRSPPIRFFAWRNSCSRGRLIQSWQAVA